MATICQVFIRICAPSIGGSFVWMEASSRMMNQSDSDLLPVVLIGLVQLKDLTGRSHYVQLGQTQPEFSFVVITSAKPSRVHDEEPQPSSLPDANEMSSLVTDRE